MAIKTQPLLFVDHANDTFTFGVFLDFGRPSFPKWTMTYSPFALLIEKHTSDEDGPATPLRPAGGGFHLSPKGDPPSDKVMTLTAADTFNKIDLKWNVFDNVETGGSATGTDQADIMMGSTTANVLNGRGGNDIIDTGGTSSGGGVDIAFGGRGDDLFYVRTGDRVIEKRGEGTDTVVALDDYTLGAGQSVEKLVAGPFYGMASALSTRSGDAFFGVKNLVGNDVAQEILGNALANKLSGRGGNDVLKGFADKDTLMGDAGNDTLSGGAGADILKGGTGRDTFLFDLKPRAIDADRITDFNVKDDSIALDHLAFTKITGRGTLQASQFKDITDARTKLDGNDHVLYDHNKGKLYYDADGSGSTAKVLIATLDHHPSLTHADILVV